MRAAFTLAVFVSAGLLFIVEPMFGKMVLPLLGDYQAANALEASVRCVRLVSAVQRR